MVASKSAFLAPIRIVTPTSWIISAALSPTMWQPRTRSSIASTRSFINIFSARPDSVAFIGRKVAR